MQSPPPPPAAAWHHSTASWLAHRTTLVLAFGAVIQFVSSMEAALLCFSEVLPSPPLPYHASIQRLNRSHAILRLPLQIGRKRWSLNRSHPNSRTP